MVHRDEPYMRPHAEFVMKRPLAGCAPSSRTPVDRFTTAPLMVYDSSGEIARMSFETDAIRIASESGNAGRGLLTEIDMPQFLDPPDCKGQYIAMLMLMTLDAASSITFPSSSRT